MYRRLTPLVLAVTLISPNATAAASQVTQKASEARSNSYEEARALAIYAPRPAYPYEARDRHLTGSGIVLLNVDSSTGDVTSAQMLKSTGYKILDNSALEANATNWFLPEYPRAARDKGLTGKGAVEVKVGSKQSLQPTPKVFASRLAGRRR
jgi:TonB family protein